MSTTLNYKAAGGKRSAVSVGMPLAASATAAVAKLDEFLNARLLAAANDAQARCWWTRKIRFKRQLGSVADTEIAATATGMLRRLRQEAA